MPPRMGAWQPGRLLYLLTFKRNSVILLLDVYTRPRYSPGHARSDGVADARNHGAAARVRAGQAHPADLRRRPGSEPGDAVSGAPAIRAARLDRIALGHQRCQSPGQILPTDARGAKADRAGIARLGAHGGPDGAVPSPRRIGRVPCGCSGGACSVSFAETGWSASCTKRSAFILPCRKRNFASAAWTP